MTQSETTAEAVLNTGLSAKAIAASVEAIMSESLYWFPVRHHSPRVAAYIASALRQRKPKLLFIEGPHEANHLIPFITNAETKPPIAIYSSYRDDDNVLNLAGICSPAENIPPKFSSWYPLLAYSPEYVAMMTAAELSIEVVFMDLPHYGELRSSQPPQATEVGSDEQEGQADEAQGPGAEKNGDRAEDKSANKEDNKNERQRETERLIVESDFYRTLTEVAGYRSWNECWDSLFEMRDFADLDAFRKELAHFCAAARATAHPERHENDGTLVRERFMWKTITTHLARKNIAPSDAFVVCGGYHLFMDRNDPVPPPDLPTGTVYTTVVPYSYFRVSELSGYSAGNRAPQFYQTVYDLSATNKSSELLVRHVVSVLSQARRKDLPLSSADAIAICQHAEMLCRLRGRPTPILDDIHDALITCCCKGKPHEDGAHLLEAMDKADIGNKIGKVTPALGQLPLLNDFYAQVSQLEMGDVLGKEKRLKMELDKRQDLDARRSAFLHRLRYLQVPLAQLIETPRDHSTGLMFREKWLLVWSPEIESELIQLALYGDTVEAASLGRLRESVAGDEHHAGRICRTLVEAIDMDLPNLIHEVEDACGRAIDSDSRFTSLGWALTNLLVIDRYALFRNVRRALLDDLITRCYDRACFSIIDIIAAPDDQQENIVSSLKSLAEVTMKGDRQDLDQTLFLQHLRQAANETQVAFLRGAMLGLLAEMREITAEDLAHEVSSLARSSPEVMLTAGDFLDGIMAVSRTSIMLGADALIAAIDELLRAADWDGFLIMLPKIRAAFERLHERQRDSLGSRVAQRYGLGEKETLTQLRTSVGAAVVIARIDQTVAGIMKEWEFK